MRSTRAAAAVARLNARSTNRYTMTTTSDGLFFASVVNGGRAERVSEPLPLDDFVRAINEMGPQEERRMTRNDIAFQKQLGKKPGK